MEKLGLLVEEAISWLDEEYAKNHTEKPRSGFPAVEKITGEPLRGERIFRQKCAVCHQKEGEGRYRDNIYYRPALWGDRSFNTSAGLLAKPEKMAAFLKANMPFGFGGHLSAEESWDLVEFLKTKKRPAGPPIKPGS